MSDSSMAPCGLVCDQCRAFLATKANDTAALLQCGKEWAPGREISAEDVKCDGCRASGRKWLFCRECALAGCEKSANVQSCAHCPDYPCERVGAFAAWGREQLAKIHDGIGNK